MSGTRPGQRVRVLQERAEWLRCRIAEQQGSPGSLGYMKAELEAHEWALPILYDLVENERDQAQNVYRQRRLGRWKEVAKRACRSMYLHEPEAWARLLDLAGEKIAREIRADQSERALRTARSLGECADELHPQQEVVHASVAEAGCGCPCHRPKG